MLCSRRTVRRPDQGHENSQYTCGHKVITKSGYKWVCISSPHSKEYGHVFIRKEVSKYSELFPILFTLLLTYVIIKEMLKGGG